MSADDRIALARAMALALGHTFADTREMRPGPNTIRAANATLGHLAAEEWSIVPADAIEARDAEIEALRSVMRVVGMDLDVEDGVGLPHPWLVLHPNGCITAKRKITDHQADAVRRALTTEGDTP